MRPPSSVPLLQRIDLADRPQIDPPGSRSPEGRIAGKIGGIEGSRNRIPGHVEAEFREIDHRTVHGAARIRDRQVKADVGHPGRKRGIAETAVAHLGFELEGRKCAALHLSLGPKGHGEFAGGLKAAIVTRVESRHERQHVLELNLLAGGPHVEVHRLVARLDPSVERQFDGIEPQAVLREGIASVRQVGVDRGLELRLGIAQQRNAARDKPQGPGLHLQVERRMIGRKVAAKAQREGCRRETHPGGVVLVADRGIRDPEIADRKPEGRSSLGGLPAGSLLRLGRCSLIRRLHHVPVHGAVLQFVRMERGRGQNHLGHLEPAVAEQRHEIDHNRNARGRGDRIALEAAGTHQRQPLEFDRRMREMAQQADVQPLEIELRRQHAVGFPLHDVGDLSPAAPSAPPAQRATGYPTSRP